MPTVNTVAALIAALADSGGGANADTTEEIVQRSNSVHQVGAVFYVVVLTAAHDFQMYSSSDQGATWATAGAPFTPSVYGGGMNSFLVGTDIWVGYSKSFHIGNDQNLYLVAFDSTGPTWGTELSFDCGDGEHTGTPMRIEGPYTTHVRLDGSFVFCISDTLTSKQWIVTYDGSFHGPFQLSTSLQLFESSVMRPDGTVDVFYGNGYDPGTFYHITFDPADTVGTETLITGFAGEILSWSDIGLEYGFESGGEFFLAAGKKNADYPTVFGRPAIFYGSDGSWVLGQLLDTGFDSDFSVYTCSLHRIQGYLVYYWRGISSDGNDYVDRIGWAPVGSHDTPADWTWQTVYDLRAPSPLVSGQADPYVQVGPPAQGATTGLIQTGNELRCVVTLNDDDGDQFVAYLFALSVAVVVNDFRVGRAYFAQG